MLAGWGGGEMMFLPGVVATICLYRLKAKWGLFREVEEANRVTEVGRFSWSGAPRSQARGPSLATSRQKKRVGCTILDQQRHRAPSCSPARLQNASHCSSLPLHRLPWGSFNGKFKGNSGCLGKAPALESGRLRFES